MMELTIFIPLFALIWVNLKNDGTEMICTIFDSKSPKALFNVSDSFREEENINNRRKSRTPPLVVEAELHENY